jgi:prevent-host-death family protein
MTLHEGIKAEVGVRELHDQLSRYVGYVAGGGEVVVTLHGRRIARLVPISESDPLEDLRARGLLTEPTGTWTPRRIQRVQASGSVSELVAEQRR